MKKKNRKHSIIEGLPSDLREAVDEMIKANFTYHEIVDYIRKNGIEISISSVQRYASALQETVEALRLAQENFRAIMEETERYPNLDITDGILRLISNQLLGAINNLPEEKLQDLDFETIAKNAVALTRAAAYKKRVDITSKDILDVGSDQFRTMLFDAMAEEEPELYEKFRKFIKKKQEKMQQ